jgi:hypothetical protein
MWMVGGTIFNLRGDLLLWDGEMNVAESSSSHLLRGNKDRSHELRIMSID